MSIENEVFRKIKEISARGMQPRPVVASYQVADELSLASDRLLPCLNQLQQMRLLTFCDGKTSSIKLTLLGTVVNRNK